MKRYILLVLLLCYPVLTFGIPPLSTIPFTTTSSTTTSVEWFCLVHDDCDDYNPCTSESCPSGICEFSNVPADCDDGLYCNGDDSCENGDCSVHSGDPCPAGTVCNEDTDSCDSSSGTSTTTSSNQGSSTTTTLLTGGSLSISGYVMGATAEDVSIILAGTASITSITDTDGYYEFPDLVGGYYTIKPDKDGYSFEPPDYVIQNLASDLEDMNFEATKERCLAVKFYGTDSAETELLRSLRDNVLSKSQEGQELITLYYQWSPVIIRAIEADENFKEEMKEIIDSILLIIGEEQ